MKPLESRKQLLLAESELPRAQMVDDLTTLTTGVRALTYRAASLESIASSTALLAMGLTAFQRGQGMNANARPSKINRLLNGAAVIAALWLALNAQRRGSRDF